jgi:hypothetical protein
MIPNVVEGRLRFENPPELIQLYLFSLAWLPLGLAMILSKRMGTRRDINCDKLAA